MQLLSAVLPLGLLSSLVAAGGTTIPPGYGPQPRDADSCTFRPTQTSWSTSGCGAITCATTGCVVDAPVTLSCGCDSMKVEPTTTTLCPTATGCVQCTTGWGLVTETQPCSTAA